MSPTLSLIHIFFEDEGVACTDEQAGRIAAAARGRSVLYLAIGGRLAGVLLISDPPRPEAAEAIAALRALGAVSYTHLVDSLMAQE